MIDDILLQNLVSNVVSEKFYSHCRLCLREISGKIVRFDDSLLTDEENNVFKPVSDVLSKLFDDEILEEIPGIDALCVDCSNQAINAIKLIEMYEHSSKLLNNIFDNINMALNVDMNASVKQSVYVIVKSDETNLLVINDEPIKEEKSVDKAKICSDCHKIFEDLHDLQNHNLLYHNLFTCKKCLDTFKNELEQLNHDESMQMHICDCCNDYYCTEESLKRHINNVHTIKVCKTCGISIKGLKKLELHEKGHNSTSTCEKCGKVYITRASYFKHIKLCFEDKLDKHPRRSELVRNFICNLCGKRYSTSSGLRVHERFVHGDAKPHVCKYCNKKFTAPSYLRAHMVKHSGEKNYSCDLCNKRFGSKEALVYHTRRHTGEKPYSCHLCEQKFVNASARAEHIKFKHVGPTLMCEMCPRKFVTPSFLRMHMQRHEDPTSKFYAPRSVIPPNTPRVENMRIKL